jgi:hypothetical protein
MQIWLGHKFTYFQGCLDACPTWKYLSIFEQIQVYSMYFQKIFKEYVQYVQLLKDVMDKTARLPARPLGPLDSLRTPNMTTLNTYMFIILV